MAKKDQILTQITSLIRTGEWRPGELLSEQALADRFSVSRSPVRDALSALAQEGLIEQIPQVGVRVRELSDGELFEIFKIRSVLEPLAIRELCRQFSEEAFETLSIKIEEMHKYMRTGNVDAFLEADAEFHSMTAALAGMKFLEGILRQIGNKIRIYGHRSSPDRERMLVVIREHNAILEALHAGRAEDAALAVTAHLGETMSRLDIVQ